MTPPKRSDEPKGSIRERIREEVAEMLRSWNEDQWPEDPQKQIESFALRIWNQALEEAATIANGQMDWGGELTQSETFVTAETIRNGNYPLTTLNTYGTFTG